MLSTKPLLVLSLFTSLLGGQYLSAQELKYVYYDEDNEYLKEKFHVSYANPSELHGSYESFYVTGNRQAKGTFTKGRSSGIWEYYFESGQLKMKGYMQDGIPWGHWEYFYESGKKSMQGNLYGEVRNGLWTFYFENGAVKSEGKFVEGVREGIWNYFYEDGNLKAQAFFERGEGTYSEFYPSGQVKSEGRNVEGKSEGDWVYYHENGELQASGRYEQGLRTGEWKFYHGNGNVSAEGGYSEGRKAGNWKYYHPDGSLTTEGVLVDGVRDGSWKLFERDGHNIGSIEYEDGIGIYSEYYDSGKIKAKGTLADDVNVGQWYYYYENGKLEGECFFTDGFGNYKGYYENGDLKMEGRISEGVRVGEWKLYNTDGSLAGTYRPIYEDEKPIFRITETPYPEPERVVYDKPEYKYKNKKWRYFTPRVNEYRGVVFAANPFVSLLGYLPVSVEFYHQERLGYEFQYQIIRRPFFKDHPGLPLNNRYQKGSKLKLRQKFYDSDSRFGMFYFGQEASFSTVRHSANTIDSTGAVSRSFKITKIEQRLEYGLFIGNRWVQNPGGGGFTIDAYLGAGIGYRVMRNNYAETPERNEIFAGLNSSSITTPIIIGLNIGYLGPRKKTNY